MQTIESWIKTYPPDVKVGEGNPEALKYGKLWEMPEYRAVSPGEHLAQLFLSQAKPRPGASVLDLGCGTGRGGFLLAVLGQMDVTLIDFVRNSLDPEVKDLLETHANTIRFLKADLEKPLPVLAEYGFCCDVMEHIPPDKVDAVLDNVLKAAQHVFFSISTTDDSCGALIGEPLHLSVHSFDWWLDKFNARGALIHFSEDRPGNCVFYVSAWADGQVVVDAGVLNHTMENVRANVKYNTAQSWTQVQPHVTNDIECMILGGGPSLGGFADEIKQKRAEGVKCITLNGTYNWAAHHGLAPSAQIIVDARPFNARFVQPVVKDCRYLIASQCDPSVFQGLPHDRTFIWHTSTEEIHEILNAAYDKWWGVPGGSTVLLRAIPLMRMLGYRKFHLYGCDSCLVEETHHAYAQPENDCEFVLPVIVNPGGRIFKCHPWMASQANEFISLIKYLGNEIELQIHGDGLLSHILETGAAEAELLKLAET